MRPVVSQEDLPSLVYMWDTLAWLNLWDWNDLTSVNTAYDDLEPAVQNQHLST
jgi:hypothetical protein